MPKFRDAQLPVVSIKGDPEPVIKALDRGKVPPETLADLAVYIARQKKRVEVLDDLDKAIRAAILAYYEKLQPEARDTVKSDAGMITYTAAGEKRELLDRDEAVKELTVDQIRASYNPDMKALETILPRKVFERLTRVKRTEAKISVRDTGGEPDL